MAYNFGGGIRPELGRTDYSGYLQGALSGAQMSAQGDAAIGRGIANAGASIGSGIERGAERKEKRIERDRLLTEERRSQTGSVNISSKTLAALLGNPDLTEEERDNIIEIKNSLDDTERPLSERSAMAKGVGDFITTSLRLSLNRNEKASVEENKQIEATRGGIIKALGDGVSPKYLDMMIPAGTPLSVSERAMNDPLVQTAIKESKDRESNLEIGNALDLLGKEGDFADTLDSVSPENRATVIEEYKKLYPERDVKRIDFGGGVGGYMIGGNFYKDAASERSIDSEAFNASLENIRSIIGDTDEYSNLTPEKKAEFNKAAFSAATAMGRTSIDPSNINEFNSNLFEMSKPTVVPKDGDKDSVSGKKSKSKTESAASKPVPTQYQVAETPAPVVSFAPPGSTSSSQVSAQQPAATQQTSSNTGGRYTAGGAAQRYVANGAAEPYNAGGAGSPANYGQNAQNVQNSQQNQQSYNFFTPPSGILDAPPPLNVSRISVSPSTPEALRVGEMARVTARDDPDYSFRSDTSSSPPISTSVPAPDEESSGGDTDVVKIATYGIPALSVLYKTAPRAAKLISNAYSSVKNFPRKNAVARVLVKAVPGLVSGAGGLGLKSLGWTGIALAVNEGVGDMVTSIINSGKGLNDKDKRKYDTGASAYLGELIAKVSTDPKNIQKIKSNILDDIDGLSKQKTKAAGDQIRFLLKLTSKLDEVGLRALNSTNYDQRLASYANTTLSSPKQYYPPIDYSRQLYAQQPGYVRPQLSGFIR
jgi:hypothetical protein